MNFGKKHGYVDEVRKTSLSRPAHLIKKCGFIMQTRFSLARVGWIKI